MHNPRTVTVGKLGLVMYKSAFCMSKEVNVAYNSPLNARDRDCTTEQHRPADDRGRRCFLAG